MQHMRSWTVQSLQEITSRFGFATVWCNAVNIQWYQGNGIFHYLADQVKQLFSKPKKPNLVYIGNKKK
jgi:hypothetical protein